MHVPPTYDAVRDAMLVFFEMLTQEAELQCGSWSGISSLSTYTRIWTAIPAGFS
jgi:hypothetical protein